MILKISPISSVFKIVDMDFPSLSPLELCSEPQVPSDNNQQSLESIDDSEPQETSDDNQQIVEPKDESPAEQFYIRHNQDKRVLLVLTLGLKDSDGNPLIKPDNEAWNAQPASIKKPLREHYILEVKRRGEFMIEKRRPQPSAWKKPELIEWLEKNPILDEPSILFVTNELKRVLGIFEEAYQVKKLEKAGGTGAWLGNLPWLRMIHCILKDTICPIYVNRDSVASRQLLDSFSSPYRQATVYKLIADRWNNPQFNPFTIPSACHDDFHQPIDIGFNTVVAEGKYAIPSEDNIHHRLTDMRSKLVRIIRNWELSGQGEGSAPKQEINDTDEVETLGTTNNIELGRLENRNAYALHSRRNFLDNPGTGKLGSWMLYFWEVFDKFQLLQCTLNVLSSGVGASDGQDAPIIDTVPLPKNHKAIRSPPLSVGTLSDADERSAISRVGEGLIEMVKESQRKSEEMVRESKRKSEEMLRESKRSAEYNTLVTRRTELEKRIYELGTNIRHNTLSRLRTTNSDEMELLSTFIIEDELELESKQNELKVVVDSFINLNKS